MHLPLSAGRMVMLWSLLRDLKAFLSWMVRLERCILSNVRSADTVILICSASASVSLFFLMADSVAVIILRQLTSPHVYLHVSTVICTKYTFVSNKMYV